MTYLFDPQKALDVLHELEKGWGGTPVQRMAAKYNEVAAQYGVNAPKVSQQAAEGAVARQIEILRGPAALLYGSGAIGGLVNVVNERIPTRLEAAPTGQVETRYSTVDNGKNVSGSADAASGRRP